MRCLCLILPLLVLLACATPEQRAGGSAGSIENDFGPACAALGHSPGSAPYEACKAARFNNESAGDKAARQLFLFSILYLFLLFGVLLVEHVVRRLVG